MSLGIELIFEDVLVPAWRTTAELVEVIGGFGDAYLVVELAGSMVLHAGDELGGIGARLGSSREIDRWTEVQQPPGYLVESVKRELLRSLILPVWEPEQLDGA